VLPGLPGNYGWVRDWGIMVGCLWRNIWAEKEERAGISEELPTLKLTLSRQRNKIFSIFPPIFSVITEENLAKSFFA